jgi:hypothetical protein
MMWLCGSFEDRALFFELRVGVTWLEANSWEGVEVHVALRRSYVRKFLDLGGGFVIPYARVSRGI